MIGYGSSDLNICSMAGVPELLRIADKIRLRKILDKYDPMKYDKDIKTSDMILSEIFIRVCDPGSFLNSIEKIKNSIIPHLLKLKIDQLNEDHFYKRFKLFKKNICKNIKKEISDSVRKTYDINIDTNDWDTSFVHVDGKQNKLAAKGMNSSNKNKPNGVKISLLHARNNGNPVPLYQNEDKGNTSDIEMFKKDREMILRYRGSLLILDRFVKSDKDLADFAKDDVLILTADRVYEKNIKEIKKLNFEEIEIKKRIKKNGKVKIKKVKMKHATTTGVVDGVMIYKHIYIDPEKAKRDKKKREEQKTKKNEQQKNLKELSKEGKLVDKLKKEFVKDMKKKGIKVDINLKNIEFEESQEKEYIDGLVVLSTTAVLTREEALPTYRDRIWVEKGIKEQKQSHMLRPIYVRNEQMIRIVMMIDFLAYQLACLLRLEHECFKNQSDNSIAEVLNAPCVLVKQLEKKFVVLSNEIAKKFGKFVNVLPKELKTHDFLGSRLIELSETT